MCGVIAHLACLRVCFCCSDHLELIDAELVSWILQVLPIIDARIEKSNITAATARSSGAAMIQATPLYTMRSSQQHLALSVLSFFNNFRVKFLNTLSHSNYYSYSSASRPSTYGYGSGGYGSVAHHHLASSSDMSSDSNSSTAASEAHANANPGIPAVDTIAHGNAANIFSRTAFFLQQPLTPHLLLQLLVRQFLTFLNFCSHDEAVVRETLDVFDSLSLNYVTSQQIANLDDVKVFLSSNNCSVGIGTSVSTTSGNTVVTSESKLMSPKQSNGSSALLISDLHFLQSTKHMKLQTLFYQILSRLVFKANNVDMFPSFVSPFTFQLTQLQSMSNMRMMPKSALDQVVLLVHKLHGIVSSVNSMAVFSMFYSWFFQEHTFSTLILRLVETFWDQPHVLHPVLAFYSELIWNKSQRIRFDQNSPNGIILFKETHKIISTYANRILLVQRAHDGTNNDAAVAAGGETAEQARAATVQGNALYESKLKGISLVLQLLTNSLNGGYANFGIMAYYNDASLRSCVSGVLQLVMSVRFSEIIHYPKVATNYFNFLEVLYKNHMELVVELCDTPKFLALISTLHEGLLSVVSVQQQQAASAIEHILKWNYVNLKPRPGTTRTHASTRSRSIRVSFLSDVGVSPSSLLYSVGVSAGTPLANTRTILDRHLAQSATLLPEILCTLFNLVSTAAAHAFARIFGSSSSKARIGVSPFLLLVVCVCVSVSVRQR